MDFEEVPCLTIDDVDIQQRRVVYQGFFKMHQVQLRHKKFEGGWTPVLNRELFERPPAVGVLLYDPYKDTVVLIEQFRIGALEASEGPWLLELVAGIVESGEEPEKVAHREAMEEAGIEIMDMEYICEYYSSPGGSSEKLTLFCGGVDSTDVGGVHGLAHEGEDIWVQVFSRAEAWKALQENYINNASTIIALQWLQMNWQRLQEKWQ